MKKLKLDPETLRVDSFRADTAGVLERGTVAARSFVTDGVKVCSEPASQYCVETDYHWNTCGNSCVNMCFPTGNDPSCAC
jgi:hypothetical protein